MADDAPQAQVPVDSDSEEVTLKRGQIPTPTTNMPVQPAVLPSAQPLILAGIEPVAPTTHSSDTVTVAANAQASANTAATPASQLPPGHYLHSTPTIPVAPSARKRPRVRNPYSKRHWALTILTCMVLVATTLGVLRYLQLSQIGKQTATRATAGGAVIPVPTGQQTPTTPSADSGVKNLVVIPKSFNTGNCVVDNGYRCTATLTLSQGADALTWLGSSQGITTKFSPPGGTIAPGQQQQVIIYVYSICPTQGSFIFASKGQALSIPWSC